MIKTERLALDQIETGMLLAQDVCNPNGTCLLSEGTVLSAATIASLRQREVDYVMVSQEVPLTVEESATLEAGIRARIGRLFRVAGADPIMLKLHNTLLQYRLSALHKSNSSPELED